MSHKNSSPWQDKHQNDPRGHDAFDSNAGSRRQQEPGRDTTRVRRELTDQKLCFSPLPSASSLYADPASPNPNPRRSSRPVETYTSLNDIPQSGLNSTPYRNPFHTALAYRYGSQAPTLPPLSLHTAEPLSSPSSILNDQHMAPIEPSPAGSCIPNSDWFGAQAERMWSGAESTGPVEQNDARGTLHLSMPSRPRDKTASKTQRTANQGRREEEVVLAPLPLRRLRRGRSLAPALFPRSLALQAARQAPRPCHRELRRPAPLHRLRGAPQRRARRRPRGPARGVAAARVRASA
ncbi:hypothetical protein OPT61_g6836 [Boeremia exigua]|uniref:Uncharacterized protein n=1 Tax=Boeremia exigua TaxID=749465 RepID=A0ACC2I4K4_9PLEO|nr:hypothetical protein OPT61_g6836 [Boeremia exigua]